jgi:hypothetical protein
MALFRSSPEKQMQRDIDAAKGNRERLAAKLAESEAAIIERRAAAQALARDGADDAALDRAEAATRSAQDRAATIAGAIADVEANLAALEQTTAEAADKALREKTAAEVELLAREVVDAAEALNAAAAVLADCTAHAVPMVPEAGGLNNFALVCRTEIPAGGDLVAKLLRVHAEAVLAGTAPAALPQPEAPVVSPSIAAKPATVALFALRPVKWKDAGGQQMVVQKFQDCALTPSAAMRALALKACVKLDDPLRRQNHGTVGGNADPALALDLDADEPIHPSTEPIQHSALDKPVIGEARILKIAR